MSAVEHCQGCASANLEEVLDLGMSAPACSMDPLGEHRERSLYPLGLLRCTDCELVQLSYVVDQEVVFAPDYPYSSGNSRALHANFEALADGLRLSHHELVVDIGANDGTLLSKFDCRRVAVEPTGQAAKISPGVAVYPEFFSADLARRIRSEHGPANAVTACNVLAHVEDIHDALEGIRLLLDDDGTLVAENHDLTALVEGNQWDTVYHEHLRYYDDWTFADLLAGHGLFVQFNRQIESHGGSFRTFAAKEADQKAVCAPLSHDFEALRERAKRSRWLLRSAIGSARAGGLRVAGISATARATTIINYCGLSDQDLEVVYELPNSDKIGFCVPGSSIPIIAQDEMFTHSPEYAVLFSWHLAAEILPKLRKRYRGTVLIPLPELRWERA